MKTPRIDYPFEIRPLSKEEGGGYAITFPDLPGIPMRTSTKKFVVCLKTRGYEVSLEPRKIYQVLPDLEAARHRQLRVIDESGDDYLYPASYFSPIELSQPIRKAVLASV